jgi:hypothetical protein
VEFLVLDLAKLKRSEVCTILVLKCLGPIEYDRVMIMTSNNKIRVWLWHNALTKDSLKSSYFFPFILFRIV